MSHQPAADKFAANQAHSDATDGVIFSAASAPKLCLSAVRAGFTAAFTGEPDSIYSAPGRVNVIGEHVDYQAGFCVPMAISHRAYLAVRRTGNDILRFATSHSPDLIEVQASTLQPKDLKGVWAGYLAGVIWALREKFPDAPGLRLPLGMDLYLYSEVPSGAGLSSSAAIECATALAVNDSFELEAANVDLISAAIQAENDFVGASTGGLDQSASILCTEGNALVLDCRDTTTTHVPWDLEAQNLALLVMDTRSPHSLSDGQYQDRRSATALGARLLGVNTLRDYHDSGGTVAAAQATIAATAPANRVVELGARVRHVLTEIERTQAFVALLAQGTVRENLREVGELLDASHESLRVDYEVTCPELDVAVTAARTAGAHGARMTGGGFGGSAIALVEASAALAVAEAVARAFQAENFAAPHFFVAAPAAGARDEV